MIPLKAAVIKSMFLANNAHIITQIQKWLCSFQKIVTNSPKNRYKMLLPSHCVAGSENKKHTNYSSWVTVADPFSSR